MEALTRDLRICDSVSACMGELLGNRACEGYARAGAGRLMCVACACGAACSHGVGAHAEIWDAEAWNAYAEGNEDSYSDMEQEVIPGLF